MVQKFEERAVHKVGWAKKLGSLAELSDELSRAGFYYEYKAGQPSYFDTGIAIHVNDEGERMILKRVELGKPAKWTGRTVGIVRTHGTPDLWALLDESRCNVSLSAEHAYESPDENGILTCVHCGYKTKVKTANA